MDTLSGERSVKQGIEMMVDRWDGRTQAWSSTGGIVTDLSSMASLTLTRDWGETRA